jgi:hypothetical protein
MLQEAVDITFMENCRDLTRNGWYNELENRRGKQTPKRSILSKFANKNLERFLENESKLLRR